MDSFIYDVAFNRLEKARWSLNDDIPWDQLDVDFYKKNPDSAKHLQQVKVIAMAEFTSLDATMMFLRDFFDDLDFSCFMSVWYYEEMKHHYALKRYLSCFGIGFEDKELRPLHQNLPYGGILPTLTMHLVGEIKLHNWYKQVGKISPEPISVKIFDYMAADELRHGQVYFEFLTRHVEKDPNALGTILRMARFMFKEERGNVKHPVPQLVEGSAEFNFNAALSGVFDSWRAEIDEANQKAERMTFKFLSKLAKEEISGPSDLTRVIKLLRTKSVSVDSGVSQQAAQA